MTTTTYPAQTQAIISQFDSAETRGEFDVASARFGIYRKTRGGDAAIPFGEFSAMANAQARSHRRTVGRYRFDSDSFWNPAYAEHLEQIADEAVQILAQATDGRSDGWKIIATQTGGGTANLIGTHPDLPDGMEVLMGTADGSWGWCLQQWDPETGDILLDGSEEFGAIGESTNGTSSLFPAPAWDSSVEKVAKAVAATLASWIW